MTRSIGYMATAAALVVVSFAAVLAAGTGDPPVVLSAVSATYDDTSYAILLERFVNDEGAVDYAGLKENPEDLQEYLKLLAALSPAHYAGWTEAKKIAFWINAYNALTLQTVVDDFPVDSIKDISGAWSKAHWNVMGRNMSLDHMEHKILREEFSEPRIHASLVCASVGCPPLRNEPYCAEALEAQLTEQMQALACGSIWFLANLERQEIWLSRIFRWYGRDFVEEGRTGREFRGVSATERAVLNALYPYLTTEAQNLLNTSPVRVRYLDYDWSLNEE